jgi:glycosyltransferase involved in cell wall biosynthesis
MRILSVHNSYQIRGGEDESREAEQRLLQEMGHDVEVYEESNDKVATLNPAQLALRTVWSAEAYRTVRARLKEKPHQIVHVQNFFPLLSPSVHYAAQAEGVPVVQTLRNYRLLCPNALFFREGQVCEDCLGQFVPWSGVVHGCYRDNQIASAAVATMLTAHRLLPTWTEKVDLYIALTEFARQKFISGGLPAEKIVVKPNFVHPDPGVGQGQGGYALFVGRLSVEKGLDTLLAAWEKLDDRIPLKIVGEGPLADQVTKAIANSTQIEWLGRKPMAEVHQLMGNARFLIFPSKWYETFGRVAIEAFAKGTPVIASDIGAIAELVTDGRTGVKFEPGNPQDLAAKVEWLLSHPEKLNQMRQEVRVEYETRYTAKQNYQQLLSIYEQVLSKAAKA